MKYKRCLLLGLTQDQNFGILQTIPIQLNGTVYQQNLLQKVSQRIPKFGIADILRKS